MSTASGPVRSVPGRLAGVNPVDHPGGAEITFLRLLRGLAARGWRVCATTPRGGPLADQICAADLEWQPLPVGGIGRGEGVGALVGWVGLRRLARDADVIYLNGVVTGRLLPGLAGSPALRVLDVNDMVERVPRFWRMADLVLADTEAIADRLRSLDPELDPRVVGVPVDLDPPAAERPSEWPDAGSEPGTGASPVIGFIGRPEPRKGVHDLLAAIPAIRAGAAHAGFVLVGDDPFAGAPAYTEAVLADAARLGVVHLPWHDNAPGLMRHLDVLVLPSRAEPFGTVLAEAMAVGTPVVATRVDGLAEVVDDGVTGRLVPPGDPPALAAAVLEVLSRRDVMATAARQRARRWDQDAHAGRISALLESRIGATG